MRSLARSVFLSVSTLALWGCAPGDDEGDTDETDTGSTDTADSADDTGGDSDLETDETDETDTGPAGPSFTQSSWCVCAGDNCGGRSRSSQSRHSPSAAETFRRPSTSRAIAAISSGPA